MDIKFSEEFQFKVAEPTAEWVLPPERERLRPKSLENVWQRGLAWLFVLTGFAFFLVVRRTITEEVPFTVATTQALVLIGLAQLVLFYLYRRQSSHIEAGTGFRRLRSKVPDSADLPITVEVFREGSITGMDAGFMWQQDGTWYFKGIQTAFRFNQQDVVPIEAWPNRIKPDPSRDKPPCVIPMKSKSGHLVIKIKVIDPYEDFAKRKRAKQFYREIYDWLVERPRGAIESLLPPFAVHPALCRTDRWRYEGTVAAIVMVAIDSAVLAGLPHDGFRTNVGSFSLFAAMGVTALLFGSVRLAWLEVRDHSVRARLAAKELLGSD